MSHMVGKDNKINQLYAIKHYSVLSKCETVEGFFFFFLSQKNHFIKKQFAIYPTHGVLEKHSEMDRDSG